MTYLIQEHWNTLIISAWLLYSELLVFCLVVTAGSIRDDIAHWC